MPVARAPKAQPVFVAVADATRRSVIGLLADGELPAGEIAGHFRISRPAVSQHLKVLRDAGLVSVRRRGRSRLYRLEGAPLHAVYDWSARYERFWNGKLRNLAAFLDSEEAT